LLVAAFLPANLFLHQYPTNEVLLATLATACVYLALRIVRDPDSGLGSYALLGALLGAAMLTKFTALLLVMVVTAVLVLRAIWRRTDGQHSIAPALARVGVMMAACVLICGWHYGRVWARFGTPLVANWDPANGRAWWQDPGYRTASDYCPRAGALREPLMPLASSVWDQFYATLWGDALCGGVPTVQNRPPWNYGLIAGGYVLALAPAAAIAIGILGLAVGFVRRPDPMSMLVVGLIAAVAVAMVQLTLKVPYYSTVKGFFGLAALGPTCIAAALGVDMISRGNRWVWGALVVLLGVWAVNAYASYWIDGDTAATRTLIGRQLMSKGDVQRGTAELRAALALDRTDRAARLAVAQLELQEGNVSAARWLLKLLPDHHDSAQRHLLLSRVAARERNLDDALAEVTEGIRLDATDVRLHIHRAAVLLARGDARGAIEAYRDALAVNPMEQQAHARLAELYQHQGRSHEASQHRGYAEMLTTAKR
jgi:Tfp pilus assembly protein PilF